MNRRTLVTLYNEHRRKKKDIEKLILQLVGHPDATEEQLSYARASYVRLLQQHREIKPKVRAAWPVFNTFPED